MAQDDMFRSRYNVTLPSDMENDGTHEDVNVYKGDICISLEDDDSFRQNRRMYVVASRCVVIVSDEFMSDFEEIYD